MSQGMILKKINDYLTIHQLTMQQVHALILSSILQFCCSYGWGGGGCVAQLLCPVVAGSAI